MVDATEPAVVEEKAALQGPAWRTEVLWDMWTMSLSWSKVISKKSN